MDSPEHIYDDRQVNHGECDAVLLPQSQTTSFSDRIELRDGRFQVRHVVQWTVGSDHPVVTGWTDLFSANRTESKTRWSENFVMQVGDPFERVVSKECLKLKNINISTEEYKSYSNHNAFELPLVRTNPFVRIPTHSGTLVVDSISLLQAVLAIEARVFELLVSPFRALAASVHRVGRVVVMQANIRALCRDEKDKFIRRTAVTYAYFLTDPSRVESLFRLVESIRLAERLVLPIFDFGAVMEVEGWRRRGANEILVERIRPACVNTWMLKPDDVLVVLPNTSCDGAIYSKSRLAISSAGIDLFANEELLAVRLSLEVVERMRRLFASGANSS